MWWERYRLRLQVLATGGGWLVERDGRTVALLTDPQPVEMFWCAWRLDPLTDELEERRAIFTDAYWSPELDGRTTYRSREYGTVCPAIPSHVRDGRLVMRGLYQPVPRRRPWDRLALWLDRWAGRPT